MTETLECAVIGAGVVGLACARALAQQGREVVVIEAEDAIGTQTSARNSEVIHAGIYYPTGSLKAALCVRGKILLYEYLEAHGVPHRRCGKLIVATEPEQMAELAKIQTKAAENGVTDLELLDKAACTRLEPALRAEAALLSPSTGIIDSHGFMLALQGDAENDGAMIAFNSPLSTGRVSDNGIELTTGGDAAMTVLCKTVVNAAGLGAQAVAKAIQGMPSDLIPARYLAKGNYFSLGKKAPFSHLIYPVPEAAGLGVHLTLDLGGQARFGPDVEWVDRIDYAVDPARGDGFYAAIRRYWPDLPDNSLHADYSGIRPKLQAPGEAAKDFVIQGPEIHGVAGLVNLFGIESPGLTSALAIAEAAIAKI